jgi:hypothetical protein
MELPKCCGWCAHLDTSDLFGECPEPYPTCKKWKHTVKESDQPCDYYKEMQRERC